MDTLVDVPFWSAVTSGKHETTKWSKNSGTNRGKHSGEILRATFLLHEGFQPSIYIRVSLERGSMRVKTIFKRGEKGCIKLSIQTGNLPSKDNMKREESEKISHKVYDSELLRSKQHPGDNKILWRLVISISWNDDLFQLDMKR